MRVQEKVPNVPPRGRRRGSPAAATSGARIWIDLDNTPHVPFFKPIIRELERRGHTVGLSARDAFQVFELANAMGLEFTGIGRHYGKNAAKKVFGLAWRSVQLAPFFLRLRPHLAVSHGSRSQILLSNLCRVPTVLIMDYEHARMVSPARPRWMIVPHALDGQKLPADGDRVRFYRGIKEDVYAPEFRPDPALFEQLGLPRDEIIITVRPPANEAHYYRPESDELLVELMTRITQTPRVRAVLLPRNRVQESVLKAGHSEWFAGGKTIVPPRAVNGLDLLWLSDLAVSGGGTMNREAAALGVPAYSIFRGTVGAVDLKLEEEGRLTMVRDAREIWTAIDFVPRDKSRTPDSRLRDALGDIVDNIEEIIRIERKGSDRSRQPGAQRFLKGA
jgi:predicted glycosyltransferase